ncbi:hypothetical protein V1L54_01110 [Streptomyces sp. TRM 70361]|uniref:hypothetical protein n=1 Tax=Streptomyces sp. TRM 70361 TaxID=3116553 RepID=UPI002E7C1AA4|nr:hypothetical protein [Streptomyces sp. TRM 70361]MEE1938030.1 hypothetical protein [Streptomyces sp. TRM 70361]
MRVPRVTAALAALAALCTVAAGAPGVARAQPAEPVPPPPSSSAPPGGELPEGWGLSGEGPGRQLVWRSAGPVPLTDAAVGFYSGDRLLGHPVADADGRTFRLALRQARPERLEHLEVRAGGLRLDRPGPVGGQQPRRPVPSAKPGAVLPVNSVDPGTPGEYGTVTGEYELPPVALPGFDTPVEMRAVVVAPAGAEGRRPLALFLHGRHGTCYGGEEALTGEWPCPSGAKPVPSHRGYLKDQELLASQGYVTVSVSANGVNSQDHLAKDGGAQARSSLVRLHLARWADWSADPATAPAAVRSAPTADLSKVLLVGHSRGGEGVNRAAMDSLYPPPAEEDGYRGETRWTIRGTAHIAPTAFGQNPVPDVPSVTILPGCDGDVSDLQGQVYADATRGVSRGAALHSVVYMVGANHNFFNSEWTPGEAEAPADDDFQDWGENDPDPVCSPDAATGTRLTAAQQHTAGATYLAAAARLFVQGDDRVRPLLDGSGVRAPSAGPAQVLTHAVGAHRTPAFLPDDEPAVTGGRLCRQVHPDPATACLDPAEDGRSPHFLWMLTNDEPGRYAVALEWSAPGSAAAVRVTPAEPVSVAGSEELALRLMVPPNTTGTRFDVALTDTSGRRAELGRVSVDGLPGSDRTVSHWAREVRVPLAAVSEAGLDPERIESLELVPRGDSGRAWLVDSWGWRPGTPEAEPAALTRIDLGHLTVDEGDSGVRTHRVPVRISGQGGGQVRLFVPEPGSGDIAVRTVTVRPGDSPEMPVGVEGNTRYGNDLSQYAAAKAVRGTVIGSATGTVTARNDDPLPEITVTPVADRVAEGQELTWRVSLDEEIDTYVFGWFRPVPVDGGTELSTADLDRTWLEDYHDVPALPERPLSEVGDDLRVYLTLPPDEPSVEVSVPVAVDGAAEPEESLRLRLVVEDGSGDPVEGPLATGRVRDAP